jgi:hypothetical protein
LKNIQKVADCKYCHCKSLRLAGNPADKETQLSHILASNNTVKSWEFDARVIGLWVAENGDVAVIAK